MDALVSVIIPVYNVEKYVGRCIQSVIDQDYRNIEIIIVDDGSTDQSGRICDQYAQADNRIRCFHKKNGGLSSARNYGLTKAGGDLVAFLDSDDFINERYISVLLRQFKGECISMCFFTKVYEDTCIKSSDAEGDVTEEISGKEALYRFFRDNNYVSAWGKLYPRNFFDNVEYPEGRIYEDYSTTYKLYEKADRVIVHHVPLYYYFMRNDSITRANFKDQKLQVIDIANEIEKYLEAKDYDSSIIESSLGCKTRVLLHLYFEILQSGKADYQKHMSGIQMFIRNNKKSILSSKHISLKIKISVISFLLSKRIFLAGMKAIGSR